MNMKGIALCGLLIVLTAVAISACGGSGSGSTADPSGGTLTKQEFVAKANAICERTEAERGKRIEVAFAKYGEGEGPNEAEAEKMVFDVALPPIRKMTKELAALPLPSGSEARAEAIIKGFEGSIARAEAKPAIVVAGNGFIRSDERAAAFGLSKCGP
jgi:hypothetical protein